MENKTCLTPISEFDSTLSEETTQKLETVTSITKNKKVYTQTIKKLTNKGIIHPENHCKTRIIYLHVETNDTNPHQLTNYDHPIASASYSIDLETNIGCVGIVQVNRNLRKYGYGTQLKKLLENHLEQDDATVSFTYPASIGGEKLARKTGYNEERNVFDGELWIKYY